MGRYIEPDRLKELLLDARENGVGEELARVLSQMMAGVAWRYGRGYGLDHEDLCQECWLLVHKAVRQYDGVSNPFNYLTMIFRRQVYVSVKAELRHQHEPLEVVT